MLSMLKGIQVGLLREGDQSRATLSGWTTPLTLPITASVVTCAWVPGYVFSIANGSE